MTSTARQCKAIKRNGHPCTAYAGAGSEYCFAHDPAKSVERAAARRAGGLSRHGRKVGNTGPVERVTLKTTADVVQLLEDEVNHVLTLEISLSRAQTIARLALAFVKCFEVSEIEQRLKRLEDQSS